MSVGSSTAAAAPLAGFPRQPVLAGAGSLAHTQRQRQMQKQTQMQMSISPEGQLPHTARAGLQLPLAPSPPLVPASPHAGPPTHPARFLARSNVCRLRCAAFHCAALGAWRKAPKQSQRLTPRKARSLSTVPRLHGNGLSPEPRMSHPRLAAAPPGPPNAAYLPLSQAARTASFAFASVFAFPPPGSSISYGLINKASGSHRFRMSRKRRLHSSRCLCCSHSAIAFSTPRCKTR